MEKRIIYYKFPDPVYPDKWTKDIGWVITKTQKRLHKKLLDGQWVILKDEDVETSCLIPVKEAGAVEITKEEYDLLDVQDESELIKDRREKKEKRMRIHDEEMIVKERKKNR